jgi:hypothetical protein
MKMSPLRRLANIISDAVTQIDEKYASANLEFPTLDKPFNAKDPASLLLSDPDVIPLSSVIVAAADQLIASARHPMQAVFDIAQAVSSLCLSSPHTYRGYARLPLITLVGQHTITACLAVACETNVTEILRDAGPEVSSHLPSVRYSPFIWKL